MKDRLTKYEGGYQKELHCTEEGPKELANDDKAQPKQRHTHTASRRARELSCKKNAFLVDLGS